MSTASEIIDISDEPLLRRVAEKVRETREPRTLRIGDENVAMVVPVVPEIRPKEAGTPLTEADIEAFEAAFGAWRDNVDTERLKRAVRR